ncbi:glycosyltransferase family 39 protein [Bacteriovoracaceae bacterium]|nr:glycosyltransferase family 39 protein [Bacteriovoracaceae bacterium]
MNLVTIAFMPISHDEAYYTLYANNLDWGFYDHPPLVGLFIKFGQIFGDHAFFLRLFFFLCQTGLILLISKFNKNLFWLSLSTLFVHSGFLAIPDSLLLVFTFAYFFLLQKFIFTKGKGNLKYSLLLALTIGLGLLGKYHLFLAVIFTFVAYPKLLLRKETLLVTILSFIIFLPHFKWMIDHDYITWKFHLFGRQNAVRGVDNFTSLIGSYIALGGLVLSIPLFYFVIKIKPKDQFDKILKLCFLGQAGFFLLLSFRNSIEGNWLLTMVVPGLIIISRPDHLKINVEKWKNYFLINFLILFILRIMFLMPIRSYPIPRLAELFQWENLSVQIQDICEDQPIYANSYQVAAKLTYYLKKEIPALHLFGRKSHYTLLEENKKFSHPQEEFCFVSNFKIPNAIKIRTVFEGKLYIDPKYKSPKARPIRSGW